MKKIVVSVILSILAMDLAGFSPQASAVVIVKRPIIRERVIVKRPVVIPKRVIVPGAVAVAPAVVVPSARRVYCRNHIPPYIPLSERVNWVDRCVIGEARPM